jgi:hypothetical protein
MAEVTVPLRQALDEGFPAICAVTGERADGAITLRVGRSWKRWGAPPVRIPLSEPVFKKWAARQNIHIKARAVASVLTAIGVVIAFRNGLLALAVIAIAVAVHLIDLWAERTVHDLQPTLEREGGELMLVGVHERFAEVVRETVHD